MPAQVGPHHGIHFGYSTGEDGYGDNLTADLKRIDNLLTRSVKDRGVNTPPGSPSNGHRYIVGGTPTGAWSGKANQIASYDSNTSAWLFYAPEKGWDVLVEDEGIGYVFSGSFWYMSSNINATLFSTVQAAVDAAAAVGGGVVELPAGTISASSGLSNAGGTTIPSHVHVRGCGKSATYYSMAGQSTSLDAFKINGEKASISNLTIVGQGSSGTGRGILVKNTSAAFENVTIDQVDVQDTPAWGIEFANGGSGKYVYFSLIRDCKVWGQKSTGAIRVGPECGLARLERVNCVSAPLGGKAQIEIDGAAGTVLEHCTFDPGAPGGVCLSWITGEAAGFPMTLTVRSCWFEDHDPGTYGGGGASAAPYFIVLDSRRSGAPDTGQLIGAHIENCQFVRVEAINLPIRAVAMYSDVNPHRAIAIVRNIFLTNQSGSMPTDDIFTDSHGHKVLVEDNNVRNANNAGSSDFTRTGSGTFTVRYAW